MSGGTDMEITPTASLEKEQKMISHLTRLIENPLQKGENSKKREESIIELGSILARNKRTQELYQMIEVTRPFLLTLGKAKAARMVRDLVDLCLKIDQDGDIKVTLLEESIQWAVSQNQNFLRQALQTRLIRLFNDLERYSKALKSDQASEAGTQRKKLYLIKIQSDFEPFYQPNLANELVRELKKHDDKDLLLEVWLEESKACYHLANFAKARASLTSARTIANSIYISPAMQAGLDMQSGILHAAEERDFQTAFSYFYEAFEGFDLANQTDKATLALKYMLLCKVMLDTPDEINHILAHKNAFKYQGDEISAILAIAAAAKNRSLKEFNEAFGHYREELQCDAVIRKHFATLSDTMLEKELCRLIEPYSHVQVEHIAKVIELPVDKVERKLAQMILDKKFYGNLHQSDGMLMIYDELQADNTYNMAVQTVRAMNEVVDVLYARFRTIAS